MQKVQLKDSTNNIFGELLVSTWQPMTERVFLWGIVVPTFPNFFAKYVEDTVSKQEIVVALEIILYNNDVIFFNSITTESFKVMLLNEKQDITKYCDLYKKSTTISRHMQNSTLKPVTHSINYFIRNAKTISGKRTDIIEISFTNELLNHLIGNILLKKKNLYTYTLLITPPITN